MYWHPRRFVRLAELPDDKLFEELEQGLTLITENTAQLAAAACALAEQERHRPARILASHAEDEAGKYLLLMDAARCPKGHLARHLKRTTNHLARLLYAETVMPCPATFEGLVEYINGNRKSHYLDGPEGVKWVYRNSLLYWREQALYVDYVERENDECLWQDPDDFDKLSECLFNPQTQFAVDLVADLTGAGLHKAPALEIIASLWRGVVPTHISEIRDRTHDTISTLEGKGLLSGDADISSRIVDRWGFPLWNVDLSLDKVRKTD